MPRPAKCLTRRLAIMVCATAVACGTPAADQAASTAVPPPVPMVGPDGRPVPPWPETLGNFLAMATATSGDALLFRRDTASAPVGVRVVGFDSTSTPGTIRDVRPLPCAARAQMRLSDAPRGWSLALDSSAARPVLIDALEDLSRADSQRVVVRIQRALNTLPDSASAMEFHALPVVVRDAWVVRLPAAPIIVARAARLRNLEAASHEELRFVVLEGDEPAFVARVAGEEESVESWDLLAVLSTARGPVLAIAREGARTLQLELVRRDTTGWRSIWHSDALSCGRAK